MVETGFGSVRCVPLGGTFGRWRGRCQVKALDNKPSGPFWKEVEVARAAWGRRGLLIAGQLNTWDPSQSPLVVALQFAHVRSGQPTREAFGYIRCRLC